MKTLVPAADSNARAALSDALQRACHIVSEACGNNLEAKGVFDAESRSLGVLVPQKLANREASLTKLAKDEGWNASCLQGTSRYCVEPPFLKKAMVRVRSHQ